MLTPKTAPILIAILALLGVSSGCVSSPVVQRQAYAKLSTSRTFEYEFPVVWKAIEASLRSHKVIGRSPQEVSPLELKNLSERVIETDWIFSRSRDKYVEYKVDGLPRRQALQTRFKYEVEARRVMGGVKVDVGIVEQIERLKADGSSDGYTASSQPDTARANELLDRIRMAIHSAPNS